jgi:outer membrane protein assembly factor BamA
MRLIYIYRYLLLLLLSAPAVLFAQPGTGLLSGSLVPATEAAIAEARKSASPFTVRQIHIKGNKRTKPYIILRELTFREGESMLLNELVNKFERSRELVFNTTLFVDVAVRLKSFEGYMVDIEVEVRERWYIFPIPYFKPVDRNLNVWIKDQNLSLNRVNYGLKFTHNNFSGRRDKLRLYLISGYTRQISIGYEQPYADRKLQHGFSVGLNYNQTRETNYASINNKQAFYKDTLSQKFVRSQLRFDLGYSYRPGNTFRHSVRVSYVHERLLDSAVLRLNPNYFGNSKMQFSFPEIAYNYEYVYLDYNAYPTRGTIFSGNFVKRGITDETELWVLGLSGAKYFALSKRDFFSAQGSTQVKFPFNRAWNSYYSGSLMGYGDQYLRGMETLVIDGSFSAILKTTYRRKILDFVVPTFIKSGTYSRIPFKVYAKTYGDLGYAYNKFPGTSRLNNKLLYTGGFGLDIVTFYDFVIKLEYSFNQLGQKDLYIHARD